MTEPTSRGPLGSPTGVAASICRGSPSGDGSSSPIWRLSMYKPYKDNVLQHNTAPGQELLFDKFGRFVYCTYN